MLLVPHLILVLYFLKVPVRDRVFEVLLYFSNLEDEDIKLKALSGLGFLCNRHESFMLTGISTVPHIHFCVVFSAGTCTRPGV